MSQELPTQEFGEKCLIESVNTEYFNLKTVFRKGTEKQQISNDVAVSIDKQLVRDKPVELIAKAQILRVESFGDKINFRVKHILPMVHFSNSRRLAHPYHLYFKLGLVLSYLRLVTLVSETKEMK